MMKYKVVQSHKGEVAIKEHGEAVASINHSIGLDFPMVVVLEEWSRAWEIINAQKKDGVNPHAYRLGWLDKAAQQKGGYSEEDMVNFSIWRSSTNTEDFRKCNNTKEHLVLWQSLKHKYIELETKEPLRDCGFCGNSMREQSRGCNEISCYRQHLKTIKTDRVNGQLMAYIKNDKP